MREIKFRAWDNEKKKYFYNVSVLNGVAFYNGKVLSIAFGNVNHVIEQFTGLLDKNNKECYEGDIVAIYDNTGTQQKYVLEWRQDMYQIIGIGGPGEWLCLEEFEGCEIIGNIYENKD